MYDDICGDYSNVDCIIYAIGNGRLNALEAQKILKQEGVKTVIFHIVDIKPFINRLEYRVALHQCGVGLVIDSDFQDYGVAAQIAYDFTLKEGKPVYTLGLEDRTAGFSTRCDNLTPSVIKIVEKVRCIT
jgi:transketolase C-terminal domain/subunit